MCTVHEIKPYSATISQSTCRFASGSVGSERVTQALQVLCWAVLLLLVSAPVTAQQWDSLVAKCDSLQSAGNVDSAIAVMTSAVTRHGPEWTEADTAYAPRLYYLARTAFDKGKYQDALLLIEPVITLCEKRSPLDILLVGALNVKGISCWALGDVGKARAFFERALSILEKSPTPDSLQLTKVLVNYASVCNDQNRPAASMKYFEAALAICERRPDIARQYLGRTINNLNNVYLWLGKYAEAAKGFEKALAEVESLPSPDSSDLSSCMLNLASAYSGLHRYPEAAALLDHAGRVDAAYGGEENPDLAKVYSRQAELDFLIGKYDKVRSLCSKSLAVTEMTFGPSHPSLVMPLKLYAQSWCVVKDYSRAMQLLRRAFDITHDDFVSNCWALTETDALRNSATMRATADLYLSCFRLSGRSDKKTLGQTADVILAAKGEVSDEIFLRHRGLIKEEDAETREIAEKLQDSKRSLSQLYNYGKPSKSELPILKAQMDSLAKNCDELENQLTMRSLSFREAKGYRKVSSTQISKLLPANSVLVEFIKYGFTSQLEQTLQPRYLAMLLTPNGPSRIVDLAACSSIDSLVKEYRDNLAQASTVWPDLGRELLERSDSAFVRLYRAIWQPIAGDLAVGTTVFLAADGTLNLVSFASIKDEQGRYLIETHPLHYLSAGRDLLRLQRGHFSGAGFLGLGDPDFRAGLANMRGGEARNLSALPYTRLEVKDVADLWQKRNNGQYTLLFGADACEDRFKREAPGKRFLHLATHGFFRKSDSDDSLMETPLDSSADDTGLQNPLLNSGLYLSGAEVRQLPTGEVVGDDGILTAFEVADLDLTSVDWVVLSACESGLGDIRTGEGVYGLRRAFQLAGARTVINALWQIPDKETSRMMESLYANDKVNLASAMQEMALRQIAENRSRNLPDNPYLWGSFIAVGDWRQNH